MPVIGQGRKFPFTVVTSRIHQQFTKRNASSVKMQQQNYDYFLVLDFEATCEQGSTISNQEIIEFPVLKVDATNFHVTDKFHEYVKPVHNPQLTDFCTKLTGITQEVVDESDIFSIVFGDFQQWMCDQFKPDERFLFVTCGNWDLKTMLPDQCKRENIILPGYFKYWMNIKKAYAHVTGVFVKGMMPMLKELDIEHVGRLHSGIDDCINITNIVGTLANMGCVFRPTAGEGRREIPPRRQPLSHPLNTSSSSPLNTSQREKTKDSASQREKTKDSASQREKTKESASQREKTKDSLYPALSDDDNSDDGMCSPLYEPYDKADDVRSDQDREDGAVDETTKPECPDFQTIIVKLKANISSKRFKSRDREELTSLCAAGKYLHLMEEEDRHLLEARLRLFYIALCYGWKVASKDSKTLSTDSVGIHIPPEVLHSSKHHRKDYPKNKGKGARKKENGFEFL